MSRIGANNAVEIITFLVLAVIWAAVQILNRGARKPRRAPRDLGRPKPGSPPETPEDELRHFFDQLARSTEDNVKPTPESSPAPSAARAPPPSRTYSVPSAHPPPIPGHREQTASHPEPRRVRPPAHPPLEPVSASTNRSSRKHAPIPFPRPETAVRPHSIEAFDPTEAAAISASMRSRVRTGAAMRSVTIPLRTSMPRLPSPHFRTNPDGTTASYSPAAAFFRHGRRNALRKAVILSAILGPTRALAPIGQDLPHGD